MLHVREERRGIVLKYDQGREEGALIDQWEDPKYEIYHMQDRLVADTRLEMMTLTREHAGTASSTISGCLRWRGGPRGSRKCWRRR